MKKIKKEVLSLPLHPLSLWERAKKEKVNV